MQPAFQPVSWLHGAGWLAGKLQPDILYIVFIRHTFTDSHTAIALHRPVDRQTDNYMQNRRAIGIAESACTYGRRRRRREIG